MADNSTIDIVQLAKLGLAKKYKTNEIFFYEGDPGNEMFIILKGKVGVFLKFDEEIVKISELNTGEFFGEMSLLEDVARSATIKAMDETFVIIINQSNFTEIISQQPQLAYRIMKGMSSRVRQQNEELIKLKQMLSTIPVNFTEQEPIFDDGITSTEIRQDHNIPLIKAPECHKDYLFGKEITCPVCNKNFKVNMVRSSKLRLKKIDPDLRQHFLNFDPIWYLVWVCPHCYYAGFNYEFKKPGSDIKQYVLKETANIKKKFTVNYSSPRTLDEVINAYYLLLHISNNNKKPDFDRIGKIWLRLSWLYHDAGDEEMVKTASQNALDNFKELFFNSTRNTSKEQEQRLSLLLGELSLRLGKNNDAIKYYRSAINHKNGNNTINKQSEDRITDLREAIAHSN